MRNLLRFFSRWQNLLGALLVSGFVFVAIAAPQLAPPDDPASPGPFKQVGRVSDYIPHPPSATSPFGTASGQADMFYSVVWGTRSALGFGLVVALSTAIFGTLVGAFSGYAGKLTNGMVMRVTDALLAFPVLAGVWLFQQILFPVVLPWESTPPLTQTLIDLGVTPTMLALVLFSWMSYARLVNANVVRLKEAEFVLASKALGVGRVRMVFKHLLPNAISPAIVLVARDVGGMVILDAAFTFIGLGAGNIWSQLLVINRNWIVGVGGNPFTYWWTYIPPTLALILFGIGWNLLGDGLNDWLNPRRTR
jgi:peptide/nickel transport system permease protein